jgi:GMP synthase (glutamine-hydrolysing)
VWHLSPSYKDKAGGGSPRECSVPRLLIFNATPASAEQRLIDAGSRTYDELIQSSLDQHLPAGTRAMYFTLRVADGERLPQGLALDDFDGVWISGSPFNVYKPEQPSVREQIELTREIWKRGIPAFGSCWGLQLMTAALGGTVRLNPRGREVGVARRIHPTAEGREHAMYRDKNLAFDALCVHEDEVDQLPACATLLASNEISRVQAAIMCDGDRSFWGVQYHPEFDFATIAAIISIRVQRHLDEGLARSADDVAMIVDDYRVLAADTSRLDLAWKHGVGTDVLDPIIRTLEFRSWLAADVLPYAKQRGA